MKHLHLLRINTQATPSLLILLFEIQYDAKQREHTSFRHDLDLLQRKALLHTERAPTNDFSNMFYSSHISNPSGMILTKIQE